MSYRFSQYSISYIQDCLLQGQAQLDHRVVFGFSTLRLRSKKQQPKEGLILEKYILSHFKLFHQMLLFTHYPPPLFPNRGGRGDGMVKQDKLVV